MKLVAKQIKAALTHIWMQGTFTDLTDLRYRITVFSLKLVPVTKDDQPDNSPFYTPRKGQTQAGVYNILWGVLIPI